MSVTMEMRTDRESDGYMVERLRHITRAGRLTEVLSTASPAEALGLRRAAHAVVWPVVFGRITVHHERRRGHWSCARSLEQLADDCLDRFHDDVEAAIVDLFAYGSGPIRDLEAWVASRLPRATVDAHRRRRGEIGALQRPRVPGWLRTSLGGDPWLVELAREVLVWVGVAETAGSGLWPLEAWSAARALVTGDTRTSTPTTVTREVERVLRAMRGRPSWYDDYVERPLGRKRWPVAPPPVEAYDIGPADAASAADDRLVELAGVAITAMADLIRVGADRESTVMFVLGRLFIGGIAADEIDRPPGWDDGIGEVVTTALADADRRDRVVSLVSSIVDGVTEPAAGRVDGGAAA
jgi:hypothetical protein